MTAVSVSERVRAGIAAELGRLGVDDPKSLKETLLIRDGFYCGRKFLCAGHSVVWFIEENEIKFFGPSGNLLMATTSNKYLGSSESVERRAA